MAQRGFCGRPTQDKTPCRNPPGCSINHGAHRSGTGAANDQAARDARAAFGETDGSGEEFARAVPDDDPIAPTSTERSKLVADVVAGIQPAGATLGEVVERSGNVPGLRTLPIGSIHQALTEAVSEGLLSWSHNDPHTVWRQAQPTDDRCDCGGVFEPGDDGSDWVCGQCGKKDIDQYPERT